MSTLASLGLKSALQAAIFKRQLLGVLALETNAAVLFKAIAAALSSKSHRAFEKQLNTNAKENYAFLNHVEIIEYFHGSAAPDLGRPFLQMKTHLYMRFYLSKGHNKWHKQKHSPQQN